MTESPLLVFVLSVVVLWLAAMAGAYAGRKWKLNEAQRDDLGIVLAAAMTLLGLVIGFSFSMAVSRYDQRKVYEEAEANAIGTEYVRADLLPQADAARVRELLTRYVDLRIQFYQARSPSQLEQNEVDTSRVQSELWSAVRNVAVAQPTPIIGLAVSGMNDVLNSQGYTQAAWWNHIPLPAWALLFAIAICSNFLVGYRARQAEKETRLFFILPALVSVSFLLIADIDSPRYGLIHVYSQNLESVSRSMHAR